MIWSKLSHPNILRFLGVGGDTREGRYSMVSELMSRGNLFRYVKQSSVNRLELVRVFAFSHSHFLIWLK